MSDATNENETLETEISKVLGNNQQSFGQRRPQIPIPAPPPEDRMRHAMASVDRQLNTETLSIEAFVDEAIHARILQVRGKYEAGPRDSYVRKMVLDAINSINASNSHLIDR
jgi:hypothetical protein